MKKRYIIPAIYLALWPIAFLIQSDGLIMLLMLPSNLVLLTIEVWYFEQGDLGDGMFPIVLMQAVFYFLIGYGLDKFAEWIHKDISAD